MKKKYQKKLKPLKNKCIFAQGKHLKNVLLLFRTDLPAYRVIENGEITNTVVDLKEIDWNDMVTFYVGCSFSFDDQLIANDIPLDQNQNICMYETNISCKEVPPFKTNMYVSLRPIPKDKLKTAVNCTLNTDFAHGAPIHIGNPESIGIPNLSENIMDVKIDLAEDEIPVFWACGITSGYAVKSAGLYLCEFVFIERSWLN